MASNGHTFRKSNGPVVFAAVLSILMISFQNCAEVSFGPGEAEVAGSNALDGEPADNLQPQPPSNSVATPFNEMFSTTSSKDHKPVDLVWIIDNSGSMNQEAAHVRNNLAKFVEFLQDKVTIRLALISQIGNTGTSVNIPSGLKSEGHIEINQRVSSRDGFKKLLSKVPDLQSNFFRANSQKAFVFVTDDNSNMATSEFVDVLKRDGIDQFKLFGFIGMETKALSPCMARHGSEYKKLAESTQGRVFNICEKDWANHFNKLADQVVSLGRTSFTLEKPNIDGIEWVKVNGKEISSDRYSLNGRVLKIDSQLFQAAGTYQVSVEYRYL